MGAHPQTMEWSSVHRVKGTSGSSIATPENLAVQLTDELRLALVATSKLNLIFCVKNVKPLQVKHPGSWQDSRASFTMRSATGAERGDGELRGAAAGHRS